MRLVKFVVLAMLAGSVAAAIPVKPAKPELSDRTRARLVEAFSSAGKLKASTLAAKGVALGPRLWAASADVLEQFHGDTKEMYGVVPSKQIVDAWKLTPLDLASVPADVRPIVAEMAKSGTPVLHGSIFQHSNEVLSAIALAQIRNDEFPFSVRRPTEAELTYYYALIPYDLED